MPISTPEIDIYADYPTIQPSLNLDFANARALDPRIAFTRGSTFATYVGKDGLIKYARTNEPRFDHDPITGESLGLLIEEPRTNYQSGNTINFGVMSIPIISGVSTADDVTTAPNGLQQAGRITGSGVDEIQRIGYNTQTTSSGVYNIFSVFVKADSGTPILGFYSNTFVASTVAFNVDLSDGTTNTINAPADFVGKVEPFPNGWYRVSVMGTGSGASGSWNINIVPSLTSARGAQSGSNASASYFIWGVQEELATSPFASSVMPFQKAGSYTREVDQVYILGDNVPLKGLSEYSFYVRGRLLATESYTGISRGLVGMGSSSAERIRIPHNNAGFVEVYSGGSKVAELLTSNQNSGNIGTTERKIALAVKKDDFAMSMDGGTVQTDTSGDIPSSIDTITLGCSTYDPLPLTYPSSCYIREFRIYPKRLTNTQLQSLTGVPTEAPPPPPPAAAGQQEFTTPGTTSWTAPTGVTSVCVVCVGGGAGSGGALAYRNNITVVPGNSYTVVVGAGGVASGAGGSSGTDGGDSSFSDGTNTTIAGGGKGQALAGGAPSGTYDGGGSGGDNNAWSTFGGTYNGAGAGGYSGDGGNALVGGSTSQAGSGGGGSSGAWAYWGGGGVGLQGEGTSGASSSGNGFGGSGGGDGTGEGIQNANSVTGGLYGGGFSSRWNGNQGGGGAVRIIWGDGRAFPSTNTADV